jgi:ATP phosphoribosyltransferase regulatory subunit
LEVFAAWSYEEIVVPLYDYAELFERGLGAARAALTYRFTDHEGQLLALRPELTTLVARTVATRLHGAPRPLRLSYAGEVFRWDPPRRGRRFEMQQVGLEHFGTEGLLADVEVLLVCAEALRALGVEGFRMVLGHAGFVQGITRSLGLSPDERETLRGLLDRRDRDAVAAFLAPHASSEKCSKFADLATSSGDRGILGQALEVVENPQSRGALESLSCVVDACAAAGLGPAPSVDLGAVGGFDYYSGLTFSVFVDGVGEALGGGGRYDDLMAQFGLELPAVGFSLALDRIADLLLRDGRSSGLAPSVEAGRVRGSSRDLPALFRRAAELRARGDAVRVEDDSEPR